MSITLGVVLVVLGACLKWAIFPAVVTSMINSQLKLTPDNDETWDAWVGVGALIFSLKNHHYSIIR